MATSGIGALDEINLEAMRERGEKMTKWNQATAHFISHPRSFVAVRVQRVIKVRMQHFFAFLQVRRRPGEPQSLAILVWGRAAEFAAELEDLLEPRHWRDMWQSLDPPMRRKADHVVCELVLRAMANFRRRVTSKVEEYRAKILWFAFGEPDTPCRQRQALAAEIELWSVEYSAAPLDLTDVRNSGLFIRRLGSCGICLRRRSKPARDARGE